MRLPHFNWVVSNVLRFVLLIMVPLFIVSEHHTRAVVAVLAILVSYIPAMVKRNYDVTMPWLFELLITLLLLAHLVGLYFEFYQTFWWWDKAAHLMGSAVIAALAFYFVFALHEAGKIRVTVRMMVFISIFFAIAIGALWEIGEYTSDTLLRTRNQGGNTDTMTDLINDTVGGVIIALIGAWTIRGKPEEKIKEGLETHLTHIEEEHRL